MSPTLVEQVYTFKKDFDLCPIKGEVIDKLSKDDSETVIAIHLHIFPYEKKFSIDMNEAFNVANNLVEFRGVNQWGNDAINISAFAAFHKWIVEICNFAEDELFERKKEQPFSNNYDHPIIKDFCRRFLSSVLDSDVVLEGIVLDDEMFKKLWYIFTPNISVGSTKNKSIVEPPIKRKRAHTDYEDLDDNK